MLDLPQLYQRPAASVLLSTLADLAIAPTSWDRSDAQPPMKKRKINETGIPGWLTRIVANTLYWIEDDNVKEQIWEAASQRLSERSGRSAMGAMTRTFGIPIESYAMPSYPSDYVLEIKLHEPALTADNLGLKTWASSYLLAKRLSALREKWQSTFKLDDQILELGAGTGLAGIAAAAIFKAHVILTDLPDIVPNLEKNRLANEIKYLKRGGSAEAAVLDWCDPSALFTQTSGTKHRPRNSFRMIVAADPIYSADHPKMFSHAIFTHLERTPDARVVMELPLRAGYEDERQDLHDRLGRLGLCILDDGEEVGFDDWVAGGDKDGDEGERQEVRCWWSVWVWK